MLSNILGSGQNVNEIQTSELKVRGKTLVFCNTVYSIPNLSIVAVGEMKRPLPWLAFLMILGGLLLLGSSTVVALALMAAGGAWVYWYFTNKQHGLRLVTNSGEATIIVSNDLPFLILVAKVLFDLINTENFRDLNINLDQRKIVEVGSVQGSQFVVGDVHGDLVNNV